MSEEAPQSGRPRTPDGSVRPAADPVRSTPGTTFTEPASAPGEEAASTEPAPAPVDGLRCIFMGPSQVGKTTLLASIDQAAHTSLAAGDPRVAIVGRHPSPRSNTSRPLSPDDSRSSLTDAVQEAVRSILEPSKVIDHTGSARTYEFSMTVTSGRRTVGADVVAHDGPGGALFPSRHDLPNPQMAQWEEQLIDGATHADGIGLCLDATDADQLASCHLYLPGILARISSRPEPPPVRAATHWERLRDRIGLDSRPAADRRRRLHARRFLLLFTKADLLVGGRRVEQLGGEDWVQYEQRPDRLAEHIDGVRQAAELLGESVLFRILAALPHEGQLGVAFTSAWGFDPDSGQPFMNPKGHDPLLMTAMHRQQRLARWTPFGVREAMVFLLTGEVLAPVSLVTAESLERVNDARRVPVRKTWPWFVTSTR